MTHPTLEERANKAWTEADGDTRIVDIMASFAESERRAVQVEALERAAGLCEFYGNTVEAAPAIRAEAERVKNGESLT